jgi:hypothetical protein
VATTIRSARGLRQRARVLSPPGRVVPSTSRTTVATTAAVRPPERLGQRAGLSVAEIAPLGRVLDRAAAVGHQRHAASLGTAGLQYGRVRPGSRRWCRRWRCRGRRRWWRRRPRPMRWEARPTVRGIREALGHELVHVVVVTILDARTDSAGPRCPAAVADPALPEGCHSRGRSVRGIS